MINYLKGIPLFGLLQVTGFLLSLIILFFYTKKNNLSFYQLVFFYFFLFVIAFIFGDLYSNIVYYPYVGTSFKHSQSIMGSFLGIFIFLTILKVFHKTKYIKMLDIIFLCFPAFQTVGKIGCYFGGCCGGIITFFPDLPLQLFEATLILLCYVVLLLIHKKIINKNGMKWTPKSGQNFNSNITVFIIIINLVWCSIHV
jgi:phosphatidylglycerol---prolipoprotein diacylglyceryl transferase